MSNRDAAHDLVHLVTTGKLLDAFEKYYDDGVVMQENRKEPMVGKSANRAREVEFVNSIEAVHSMSAPDVLVDGDQVVIHWIGEVTFKGGYRVMMDQLAHQTWKGGKIVNERFVYDTAA
ncbi:MAG: SnoaL-like domain-containing protein [Gemmatimonadales bacterium]